MNMDMQHQHPSIHTHSTWQNTQKNENEDEVEDAGYGMKKDATVQQRSNDDAE